MIVLFVEQVAYLLYIMTMLSSGVRTHALFFVLFRLSISWTSDRNPKSERTGRNCYMSQSQIQDFPKEGARFRVKCHVDAIQWGGVVAEIFRGLQKPTRESVGGGG